MSEHLTDLDVLLSIAYDALDSWDEYSVSTQGKLDAHLLDLRELVNEISKRVSTVA